MIILPLHLLRLLPFFFGGHRQLAIEILALRHELSVYKRTTTTLRPGTIGERLLLGWRCVSPQLNGPTFAHATLTTAELIAAQGPRR